MSVSKRRKHIAILAAFGPEVRAFVHSGLAQQLAQKYEVTVITLRPQSRAFSRAGVPVVGMPNGTEGRLLAHVRYWVSKAHESWLRAKGRQKWRHYLTGVGGNAPRERRIYRLARYTPIMRALTKYEHLCAKWLGTQIAWARLFRELGTDCLVTSSFASGRARPALQSAVNLGIATVVVTNSWKDAYATPYVHVLPTRIAVWSEGVARDILAANPHLSSDRVVVTGSLHLDPFLRLSRVVSRDEFCRSVGLDPNRSFVCYTAAAPSAVRNEEFVVEALAGALKEAKSEAKTQILLRLNPMEDGSRFRHLVERFEDLVIQKPDWEWYPEQDWCCAMPGDVDSWVATVYHAAVNVSIPSTVTLEFASLNKPVVNVCFDLPDPLPPDVSNRRFWLADFYAEVREAGLAIPAFSVEELIENVYSALRSERKAPALTSGGRLPVEAVMGVIEEAVGE